jgi:hypothetical protein
MDENCATSSMGLIDETETKSSEPTKIVSHERTSDLTHVAELHRISELETSFPFTKFFPCLPQPSRRHTLPKFFAPCQIQFRVQADSLILRRTTKSRASLQIRRPYPMQRYSFPPLALCLEIWMGSTVHFLPFRL